MTLTEIVELVAVRIGAEPRIVWGFVRAFTDTISERLNAGDEVKIQGLGTFKWVEVPEKKMPGVTVPAGRKLKFFPAKQFKHRRIKNMSDDEGMTKYAVVTDEETDKEKQAAQDGKAPACRVCDRALDDGGACPVHGTAPFEPSGA